MDCVGCEKCRLWGKLQVSGLGTGLKLLFSDSDLKGNLKLSRGEVVSFINTIHRFSESLHAVESFRVLWANREGLEGKVVVERGKEGSLPVVVAEKPEMENVIPISEPVEELEVVVEPVAVKLEEPMIEEVVEKVIIEIVESIPPTPLPTESATLESPSLVLEPPSPIEPASPSSTPARFNKLFQERLSLFSRWVAICRGSIRSCIEMMLQYTSGTVVTGSEGKESRTFLDEL